MTEGNITVRLSFDGTDYISVSMAQSSLESFTNAWLDGLAWKFEFRSGFKMVRLEEVKWYDIL